MQILFCFARRNSLIKSFHEKFQVVGIEGGLFGDWIFESGCSAVGHIGGLILYSKLHLILKEDRFLGENGAYVFHIDGGSKTHTSTPTLDYFIGLQYDATIWEIAIKVHVGWEQHVFFNLNQLALTSGNFSTQELNLGLDIGF